MANNVGTVVKKLLQEMVVPELSVIKDALKDVKSDVRELKVEVRRLDEKIDSGLTRLDEKIDSLRNEMTLERNLGERIASLESRVAALTAR